MAFARHAVLDPDRDDDRLPTLVVDGTGGARHPLGVRLGLRDHPRVTSATAVRDAVPAGAVPVASVQPFRRSRQPAPDMFKPSPEWCPCRTIGIRRAADLRLRVEQPDPIG
ncbi:hypothetical protein [Geodermatophilus maliterrae]|uniref:Uncharacterized protein n=1 Tax=Geodermatophilus maliterrae TaxID=3162531 RepID=A0ABV3XE60_9ACTN